MSPWCVVLICSWRRLSADRHSLPFPWTLFLPRRWCPSASHHPVACLFLLALSFPLWPGLGGRGRGCNWTILGGGGGSTQQCSDTCPSSAADSVDVVGNRGREAVVHHRLDVCNVQAPSSNVRGHHHRRVRPAEGGHGVVPLALGHVAVDAVGPVALLVQGLHGEWTSAVAGARASRCLKGWHGMGRAARAGVGGLSFAEGGGSIEPPRGAQLTGPKIQP